MRALYLILPILCILAIAYRYYSAFIAARIMALDDTPVDAGAPAQRRPELSPDPSPGPLRPSFRRDYRRRPADRPGPGRAVRLRARAHLARRGRLPGRRGPRLHHPLGLDPARRPIAGARSPGEEIGPVAGATAAVAILFIIVIALAGLGPGRRQRASGERLGHVHHRRVDSARAVHGPLHVPLPQGADRRGDDHRGDRAAARGHRSASRSRPRRSARGSSCRASS